MNWYKLITPQPNSNGSTEPLTESSDSVSVAMLEAQMQGVQNDNWLLQETVRDLELALDSLDWRRLTHESRQEFTREGIGRITEIARLFYLKNPLIKRGVNVQSLYVWGQGWSVNAKDETIQEVIAAFLDDRKNKDELTTPISAGQKESEQQTDGNTFLIFFTNKATGRVRVRSIPLEEIIDIYCSPDDAKEPWYYRREWSTERFTSSGSIETETQSAYYPDWHYNPTVKPQTIGGIPVMWDRPIFHIKTGAFSNWKFGLSEVYAAHDWARAYKNYLEDFASITRAHRRFAWDVETPGGKNSIAAAKTKLNTTVGTANNRGYDTNPPPLPGSSFIHNSDAKLNPVRTAGATSSLDEGRRFSLMVFSALGLPETFFGDVSVGTLATANSLDRPTELAMRRRQVFWQGIFEQIFDFVLIQAFKAVNSPLRGMGRVVATREGQQIEEHIEWNDDVDCLVDIDFPPIINRGLLEEIQSIVMAGTLGDGQGQLAGTIDIVTLSRMLLSALGEDDIDQIMSQNFPDGEIPDWSRPEQRMAMMAQMRQQPRAEATETKEAAKKLQERLVNLWEARPK